MAPEVRRCVLRGELGFRVRLLFREEASSLAIQADTAASEGYPTQSGTTSQLVCFFECLEVGLSERQKPRASVAVCVFEEPFGRGAASAPAKQDAYYTPD